MLSTNRNQLLITCNMDESQKHYAKFKKVDTKGYILDDPIYMTFRKRQNCKDRNQVSGCERLGLGERED